ncbi:hypothetical protein D3C76_761470 [compost metagenome]
MLQAFANGGAHLFERLLLRLAMLLDAQNHDRIRVQLDCAAVRTILQYLGAERRLHDLAIGCYAFTTFTTEGFAGLNLQTKVLGRLSQIGSLVGRTLPLLGYVDKALLDQLPFDLALQLRLQALEARHFRSLDAQQLDQVPTVLGLHRGGDVTLALQSVESILEGRVVDATAGVPQITAIGSGTGVVGELLGQLGEIFTLLQASLDLVDLGLGLLRILLVIDLDEDVRGVTLLGEVGDLLLIQRVEILLLGLHLVEEGGLLQFHVIDDDLIGAHEFATMRIVVSLDVRILDLDLARVGLEGQGREVASLPLQARECLQLGIGNETTASDTGAQLANEHFLLEHLAELHTAVTHLTDHLIETVSTEFAVNLEFGGLQDHLIQGLLGEGELVVLGSQQEQFALEQAFESGVLEQLFIQQRSVEVLAQALHQLAALHFDRLL